MSEKELAEDLSRYANEMAIHSEYLHIHKSHKRLLISNKEYTE